MRLFLIASAVFALGACQKAEAPPAEEAASTEAAAPTVANGSGPGTYTATSADGTVTTTVINADGTYSDTDADGKVVAEGSWAVKDGKTCFSPTTEGAEAMCFTETAPGADGSFTATPDKGEAVTVRPVTPAPAEPAAAEPAAAE